MPINDETTVIEATKHFAKAPKHRIEICYKLTKNLGKPVEHPEQKTIKTLINRWKHLLKQQT